MGMMVVSDAVAPTRSPQKSKRMTTNKGKRAGVHFYEAVDVKNRNRERKKPKLPKSQRKAAKREGKHK